MNQAVDRQTKILAVLAVVLPLLGFWAYGLTDLDEGFYGAVVTDMLRRGDWITPTLNGVPWFEKPIFSYWVSAPFLALWHSEFMARFPSALASLATSFMVFRVARHRLGEAAGVLSAVVYGTALLTAYIGRAMMTDAVFVLCLSGSLFLLFDSFVSRQSSRLWSALLIGLAVLAKGPVSLLILGAVSLASFWQLPDRKPNFGRFWVVGTLIVGIVALTWYLPCYLRNGEVFVDKFLIEQNLNRFLGKDLAHAWPAWSVPVYYPVILALDFAWWLAPAFRSKWLKNRATDQTESGAFRKFLWAWALFVLAFFSLSGSKLPHYILPATVPLAILIADAIANRHPCGHPIKFWVGLGAVWGLVVSILANVLTSMDQASRFADVQALASQANEVPGPLYAGFERKKVDYSLKLSQNDTSHPSIGFYYKTNYKAEFTEADLVAQQGTFGLLTRDEDYSSAVRSIQSRGGHVEATQRGRYVLYVVTTDPGRPVRD